MARKKKIPVKRIFEAVLIPSSSLGRLYGSKTRLRTTFQVIGLLKNALSMWRKLVTIS
jgi:hypothetical protein